MKTAFATVIYKQAKPYLQDLLNSVDNQTDKDFDLLIFNDNYTPDELASLDLSNAKLIDLRPLGVSIVGTRIEMLKKCKSLGYDLVIIGDADDTFAPNRVEQVKKTAELDKDSVFFYNKLITDSGNEMFKTLPKKLTKISNLAQYNFVGMSTSAIKVQALSDDFIESLYEGETAVWDWYLYSRILLEIGPGALVDDTSTIYRIYDNNEVGTKRDLNQEYNVKLIHYTNLAKRYDYFKGLLDELKKLDVAKLHHSDKHQGYWWNDIQLEIDNDNN
ncbi:MAG: glycosyltransferase family 2 protein [Pseudobutyrivibrio sp.]|nr:glycosyltransferase family 2 protein [Pseudobutyrivibrio sp.]